MDIQKTDKPGNCWSFDGTEVYLPLSVSDTVSAEAWWASHGHELDPEYVPPVPPPNPADVHAERDRRLALGFDYDFGDSRGVHRIGTTDADMRGWNEVTMAALTAVNLGAGGTLFNINTDTGMTSVSAAEWLQILAAVTVIRQAIWGASFVLESQDPVPVDYANDAYWA